jgi:hypothetical protein
MKGLKVALWICGIGCLLAVPFVAFPWTMVENIYQRFGQEPPATIYFFRITCWLSGLIGVYFIILARNPSRYGPMLALSAFGLISFGLLCLAVGLIMGMSPSLYVGDASFGLVFGIVIAILSPKALRSKVGGKTITNER